MTLSQILVWYHKHWCSITNNRMVSQTMMQYHK